MGFDDPRYRGNRKVYLILAVVALVMFTGMGLLFRQKNSRDFPGSPVVAAPAILPSPPPLPPPPSPVPAEVAIPEDPLVQLRAEIGSARDWAKIEMLAQEILKIEPEDGSAWSYLARVYETKGDDAQALAAYERSVGSPSGSYYGWYLKALFHRRKGDFPAALACMERAAELKADSVSMANLLLIFQIQAGQKEGVRNLLRSYEAVNARSNEDQWLLAASALALQEGNKTRALWLGSRFRNLVRPEIYRILIGDPFFDAYRNDPELLALFGDMSK